MINYKTLHKKICLLVLSILFGGCAGTQVVQSAYPPAEKTTAITRTQIPPSKNRPLYVLFIGNSYTYYNNLPLLFANLVQSGGHKTEVDMIAKGDWTLSQHAQDERTLSKITERKWHYVILQEYSSLPALASIREALMYPASRTLNEQIRANGSQTIFFLTWGYRHGIAYNGLYDYYRMQQAIYEGYMKIAEELEAILSPVGLAWQLASILRPQLVLWQDDGSHPDLHGSYLAACVFYTLIYKESPLGVPYTAGLSDEEAFFYNE